VNKYPITDQLFFPFNSFLAPPLEPRGVEIFDKESDELSVRWRPPEDSDAFKVEEYVVQHRKFKATIYTNASFPATKDKDTYSFRIQNLEPKTTYMIRVGAINDYGYNFNEEKGHETLKARKPFIYLFWNQKR